MMHLASLALLLPLVAVAVNHAAVPDPGGFTINNSGSTFGDPGGNFGVSAADPKPQCVEEHGSAGKNRKVGYYQGYNIRTRPCNKVWPDQIKYEGFTHLVWAFASIDPTTYELVADDKSDLNIYPAFTALKKHGLQTWVSVGGWYFSNQANTKWIWSAMVGDDGNRAKFVKSVVPFLEKHGFQGLDLDWEWPSQSHLGGHPSDKEGLVKLVRDLRAVFGTKFGLSSMLPAEPANQRGQDVKSMEQYVDWFG
jgi:chitinase